MINYNKKIFNISPGFFASVLLFFAATNLYAQNGLVTINYSNGKPESEIFYIRGILDGTSKWYYYYGVLKEERNYTLGKLNGWQRKYYENGAIKEENYFRDGRRDGIAKEFYVNGGLKTYLEFDQGILKEKRSYYYDSTLAVPKIMLVDKKRNTKRLITGIDTTEISNNGNGNPANANQKTVIKDSIYYAAVIEYPEPVNGLSSIYDKIHKPDSTLTGEMIIKIYVDENGKVTDSFVLKGIDPVFDPMVNNIVQTTKFNPGKRRGIPVKTQKNLYLNF